FFLSLLIVYKSHIMLPFFIFPSRRRHTRSKRDWSSDVCSSDLLFIVKCILIPSIGRNGSHLPDRTLTQITGRTDSLPVKHIIYHLTAVPFSGMRFFILSSSPLWRSSTILLPTMTPSERLPSCSAISTLETPNPAHTGTSAIDLIFSRWVYVSSPNDVLPPVVPLIVTAYRNPSAPSASSLILSSSLVKVTSLMRAISFSDK